VVKKKTTVAEKRVSRKSKKLKHFL